MPKTRCRKCGKKISEHSILTHERHCDGEQESTGIDLASTLVGVGLGMLLDRALDNDSSSSGGGSGISSDDSTFIGGGGSFGGGGASGDW